MTDAAARTDLPLTESTYRTLARAWLCCACLPGSSAEQRAGESVRRGHRRRGLLSFNLITRGAAQGIATGAAERTTITPLGAFYRDVVLPTGVSSGSGSPAKWLSGSGSPLVSQPGSWRWAGCCSSL
jgi:hypothetical protein